MAADLMYRYKPLPPVGTQPFVHIFNSFKNGIALGLPFGVYNVLLGKPMKFGAAIFNITKLTLGVAAIPTCYTTSKFIITSARDDSHPWLNDVLSMFPTSLLVYSMTGSKTLQTAVFSFGMFFTVLRIRAKQNNEDVAIAKLYGGKDEPMPKFYAGGYNFE